MITKANIGSDHRLVRMTIRILKKRKERKKKSKAANHKKNIVKNILCKHTRTRRHERHFLNQPEKPE